ncbi:MAG: hypothetical protein EBR82_73285 [Caulobacteraceae bacterium]|nr:hypothetical protein [Caulobacteraceae bacterium]
MSDATQAALDAIAANLAQPKRARTDAGEVEQHDLDMQIEAARFIQSQSQAEKAGSPFAALRRARISYPGASD